MDGTCSTHEYIRTEREVLVGKPLGKRTFGRPGRRWEIIAETDLGKYSGRYGRIQVAQKRVQCQVIVNTVKEFSDQLSNYHLLKRTSFHKSITLQVESSVI
jgi:hypothetical protein